MAGGPRFSMRPLGADPGGQQKTADVVSKLKSDPTAPFNADIPTDRIHPNLKQPRKHFAEDAIDELAQSIIRDTLLEPIVVRPMDDDTYQIIVGERRWRAHRKINRPTVPCKVLPGITDEDALVLALIENLQREDLKAIEKADAIRAMMETEPGMTIGDVATRLSLSRMQVHKLLNIHKLPDYIQAECYNTLSEKHARALYQLQSYPEVQRELFDEILAKSLSGAEALAKAEEIRKSLVRPKPKAITKQVIAITTKLNKVRPKLAKLSDQDRAVWHTEVTELKSLVEAILAELEP